MSSMFSDQQKRRPHQTYYGMCGWRTSSSNLTLELQYRNSYGYKKVEHINECLTEITDQAVKLNIDQENQMYCRSPKTDFPSISSKN